jgi:glycosyltransferase involved in cell wall biosynthesis
MNEIMIEEKTILCFASGYDAPPTSKHHVMHILAERNVVLWVNYHASRVPNASSSDLLYIMNKLRQVIEGLKHPRKNLYVLTPLVIPIPRSPIVRRLNRLLLIAQIRMALDKVRNGPTQIWSFTPDIAYALGHFSEEKVVYYCVDDHASFSGYNKAQVLRDEEELCQRSNLVVTTSMALQEAKNPWNPNTIFVPHGVDYDHFSRALYEDLPCPADMVAIPRPRLGFFGLIRDWVDLDLLAQVARKRSTWHFVLIGDADSSVNLSKHRAIPNMHLLGRKRYEELPTYCKAFDVGLIPFKLNELTLAVNPIKLREYLAAGLPVISTSLPEVKLYENLIEIVNSPAEFEAAVEKCLTAAEADRTARLDAMSRETWPQKVEHICEALP